MSRVFQVVPFLRERAVKFKAGNHSLHCDCDIMIPQPTDIVRVCKKLDCACQHSFELKPSCSSIIWISRDFFFGIENYCDLKVYVFLKTTKTPESAWGLITNLWHTQLCNNISARLAKPHTFVYVSNSARDSPSKSKFEPLFILQ